MADENGRRDDPGGWILSPDYDRAVKDRRRTLVLGSLGLGVGTVAWVSPLARGGALHLIEAGAVWFVLAGAVAYFRYYAALRRYQEKQESADLAAGSAVPGFPYELMRSRRQMAKNILMYGNQARNSDRNSQAAMILGLLILTGAAAALMLVKSRSAQVVFGGVGVVGAAYAAYISRTFNAVRESALERFDRVSSRMEREDDFLLAERMIHDIPKIDNPELQAMMREILEARLIAIQSHPESAQVGDRPTLPAPRRKTITVRKVVRGDRRLGHGNRLPARPSPARPGLQEAMEAIQALLQTFGVRLSPDGEAWPADDDEEEPPAR